MEFVSRQNSQAMQARLGRRGGLEPIKGPSVGRMPCSTCNRTPVPKQKPMRLKSLNGLPKAAVAAGRADAWSSAGSPC